MIVDAASRPAVPLQWQVNSLKLAGLAWGHAGQKPLLALHGWLDNAASFALLGPLLVGHHVIALDLTGHGQSAHRSADANYQIWDDLPEILGVLEDLGWESFDLLGHSRGAIIATLLASSYPERVNHLVLLDAVSPEPVPAEAFPQQMRKSLQDKPDLSTRANRVFPSVEEALASRVARGLPKEAATLLVERNLRHCDGGVTWVTDPRLHGASAVKLTKTQIVAVLQALDMPTLLLLARHGSGQIPEVATMAREFITSLTIDIVEGSHHFHMEPCVNDIAQSISSFLHDCDIRDTA